MCCMSTYIKLVPHITNVEYNVNLKEEIKIITSLANIPFTSPNDGENVFVHPIYGRSIGSTAHNTRTHCSTYSQCVYILYRSRNRESMHTCNVRVHTVYTYTIARMVRISRFISREKKIYELEWG